MTTNLAINDQLLNNALEIGGFRTKKIQQIETCVSL